MSTESSKETIADIIAEMRAHDPRVSPRLSWDNSQVCEHDNYFADRLEAAHERELSKNVSKNGADFGQLGDAAKLREALQRTYDLTNALDEDCAVDPVEIRDIACAALSAPPRNCDRYTADELKVIFKSELDLELPIANEHEKNLIAITAMGVVDTLLAPATEREGGAK